MEFKKPNRTKNNQRTDVESHPQSAAPVRVHRSSTNLPASHVHKPNTPDTRPPTPSKKSYLTILKSANKKPIAIVTSVALISIVVTGSVIYQQSAAEKARADQAMAAGVEKHRIIPEGKKIAELGGWQRVSPETSDPVYAYTDSIDTVPISVSQQSLPQSFEGNVTDATAELAKKFNATNKQTAGETTFYIGTSAKGPQSTIFTKSNLLILIKSKTKISDKSWASYIQSLR